MNGAEESAGSEPPTGSFRAGLVVFSGPSGSGKTSICKALLEDRRTTLSVSATTRPPRPGDRRGVDYHFYSKEEFLGLVDAGEFIEWAEVYDHLYGTLRGPLVEASRWTDRLMVLDIDVQGAVQLRQQNIEATYVFVAPPSLEVLRQRLSARGTDDPEVVERRLRFAKAEMDRQSIYDHVLVNADLAATIQAAREILGLG